jgi:hypothetical protein
MPIACATLVYARGGTPVYKQIRPARRRLPRAFACAVALCLVASGLHGAEAGAIRTGSIGAGRLRDLFILPDGQVLRVLQHHVELTDLDMVNVTARFAHRGDRIGDVTLSADAASFAIVSNTTGVERWDIAPRSRTSHWIPGEGLRSVALSPDLTRMAIYDANAIVLLASANGAEIARPDWPADIEWATFAFSHGNTRLFASRVRSLEGDGGPGVWERRAELWDLDSLQLAHTLEALRTSLRPSNTGPRCSVVTADGCSLRRERSSGNGTPLRVLATACGTPKDMVS